MSSAYYWLLFSSINHIIFLTDQADISQNETILLRGWTMTRKFIIISLNDRALIHSTQEIQAVSTVFMMISYEVLNPRPLTLWIMPAE